MRSIAAYARADSPAVIYLDRALVAVVHHVQLLPDGHLVRLVGQLVRAHGFEGEVAVDEGFLD